jgi:hypothetical protein
MFNVSFICARSKHADSAYAVAGETHAPVPVAKASKLRLAFERVYAECGTRRMQLTGLSAEALAQEQASVLPVAGKITARQIQNAEPNGWPPHWACQVVRNDYIRAKFA